MARVLLVDDEPSVRFTMREIVEERGHEAIEAGSAEQALARLGEVDLVLSDLAMPGMDGLELLAHARAERPALPFVLVTARGSERLAVRAMKAGALDYLVKPFDVDELGVVIDRALERVVLERRSVELDLERALGRPLVGTARAWTRVLESAVKLASRNVNVLVTGETGTGKELVASVLHVAGSRASRPLVRFNAAAIPSEVAESELFGHAKGAFTGATAAHRGFFAQADLGTLIIDEVGELPLPLQSKLLRAIAEQEIQPVGGKLEKVDVRVVACTNRDLLAEAKAGRFREDLYYRLAVVELRVPPLRERREDVPSLARAFAARFAARFELGHVHLDDALVAALAAREWPGNVRELEGVIARLVALSDGGEIGPGALDAPPAPSAAEGFRAQVEAFERGLLTRALEESGGNQSEAARRLRLSRATFVDKLRKLGLG